ncbi:MAG: D-hexose-6-phosphate mutarotase [Rhodothermales bacterium]
MQSTLEIDQLSARFALGRQIMFVEGPGGLPMIELAHDQARATISLLGGQVLKFQPAGAEPVLWMSEKSLYEEGRAIRGGIPVCWPWFGPAPSDESLPNHGFVRNRLWEVRATRIVDGEAAQLRLGLSDDAEMLRMWPHPFDLELIITVDSALTVELVARNTGHFTYVCGGALHTYLIVGNVKDVLVHGLDGVSYIDQLRPEALKQQDGPIRFFEETDNIYLDTTAACVLEDPNLHRRIVVEKGGSKSTVVWNPWIAKSRRMADFGDDEYLEMVCIETANAGRDLVSVPPRGQHRLKTTLRVMPL